MGYLKRAFALFLTNIKVSNAPLQSGLEVMTEAYEYFTDIAFHRYCIRYVASNFNTYFNEPTLKALALKARYATHEAKFKFIMQTNKDVEINALRRVNHLDRYMPYTYLMSEDLDKWTQSHDDGRRYRAMTTNISECFNGVIKSARGLPIATMVEFTWCKFVAYFHDRYKEITFDLS